MSHAKLDMKVLIDWKVNFFFMYLIEGIRFSIKSLTFELGRRSLSEEKTRWNGWVLDPKTKKIIIYEVQ